jgi:hypothetical protein
MTDEPKTSEQPSGHLRWYAGDYGRFADDAGTRKTLQQLWYITTYRGLEVEQVEEWRDVPVVSE